MPKIPTEKLLISISKPADWDQGKGYAETTAVLSCAGSDFTLKGKTVLSPGWKAYLGEEQADKPLPELTEGQSVEVSAAAIKEGKTTPPKHFTDVISCQCGEWKAPRKKGAG